MMGSFQGKQLYLYISLNSRGDPQDRQVARSALAGHPYENKEKNMVLEVAILDVKAGQEREFEDVFVKAAGIISSIPGYHSHQLQKCIEKENRYILLAQWETFEAHTVGFRGSPEYQEWRKLLHHFYDPFPTVEHYEMIFENK
jgi:heme-degrading monooxygenase HmoA